MRPPLLERAVQTAIYVMALVAIVAVLDGRQLLAAAIAFAIVAATAGLLLHLRMAAIERSQQQTQAAITEALSIARANERDLHRIADVAVLKLQMLSDLPWASGVGSGPDDTGPHKLHVIK